MNRVGIEGRGESVWLGWFLCAVLESFSRVMEKRKPALDLPVKWRAQAAALASSIEHSGWDGEWYLRGFFDNGAPLGSHANQEARIDSLPQSWAVISQAPQPTGRDRPWSRRSGIWWTNPIVSCGCSRRLSIIPEPNPGYIMGYPPGLRENGGQYTHGSLWMAMARARMGDGKAAVHLLKMMNPVELTRDAGRCRPLSG